MKRALVFLALLSLALPVIAQTAQPTQPTVTTFNLTLAPISLPGNIQTVAGVSTGAAITITPNFDFRDDNILATDGSMQVFAGGVNYRIPALAKMLNNLSPNLNGLNFQFYVTGSMGVDRVAVNTPNPAQHYAFMAGGGFNYAINGSSTWTLGAEIRYAKLPGYANNTFLVAMGPSIHF